MLFKFVVTFLLRFPYIMLKAQQLQSFNLKPYLNKSF